MGSLSDSSGRQYTLLTTLGETHRQQLLDFSRIDPLILRNTSDTERFASAEKLTAWLAGERLLLVLCPADQPDVLAGLIWFSREMYPLSLEEKAQMPQWTFAIRLYESARGKRLSLPFMAAAFAAFEQEHPHQSVWLSTRKDNAVSQKIYTQFGFRKQAQQDGRVFYVYNSVV
jgi:hypothetical protein